jgi:Amt family ammonium transporter
MKMVSAVINNYKSRIANYKLFFVSLLVILAFASPVFAGEASELNSGDTAWILTSTALVLFMTLPGLALFYGGLVRTKNVLSVLLQCFAISGIVTILWLVAGYSLAFSDGNAFIGGLSKFLFAGVMEDSVSGGIPESLFALFQMTFAIITPALIVGGFAERMKFSAILLFSSLWLILVYCPITHWVWGGGWLQKMGLLDFAGGTVVHITAGVASLVAALVLGRRDGFPTIAMPPHNMTMTVTGAGMLWVGWFGFNGGSALAANGDAAMAMLATHISAAAGAMTWMFFEWKKFGKPTALGTVTGMVAGLGTITAASGFVGPAGALVMGIIAGFLCFNAVLFMKTVLKIDDSLDVFPVHGVGGITGTMLAGVFASTGLGVFSGQGFAGGISSMSSQLFVQFIGVAATVGYTAVVTFVVLKAVNAIVALRVCKECEVEGLDVYGHGEQGYIL